MTRPDLEAIRARCIAATPGPWTYDEGCGYVEVPPCGAVEFKPGWERSVHFLARVHNNRVEGEDGLGFDGAFIAAARTDAPALLAYIEELERERDEARVLAELSDGYRRERDEALAKMREALRAAERRELEALAELDEARGEIEVLRASIDGEPWGAAVLKRKRDEARADAPKAYRRGAEAMREAAAHAVHDCHTTGLLSPAAVTAAVRVIRALPIPEEP